MAREVHAYLASPGYLVSLAVMGDVGLAIWGALGAALAELINMRGLYVRARRKWRADARTATYWLFAFAFVAAGAVTALAQRTNGAVITRALALNVGFTWPLLIRRAIGAVPAEHPRTD